MRTIAVMNQKGGAGKSTTAVHAAVAAMQAGAKVVLIDTDPQKSAMVWAKARGFIDPVVIAAPVTKLAAALQAAETDGYEIAIIDTQPRGGPDAIEVARKADLVLVPVRGGAFDFASVSDTLRIVHRAQVEALLVLSACRSPARTAEAREALAQTGVRLADTVLTDRVAYSRALDTGRAVLEFEPRGKAAAEIKALLDEVLR